MYVLSTGSVPMTKIATTEHVGHYKPINYLFVFGKLLNKYFCRQ